MQLKPYVHGWGGAIFSEKIVVVSQEPIRE
jgi:hypothetical protein